MSGKGMTRAEFVRRLLDEVRNGAKIAFYAPKSPENAQKVAVFGHFVDESWARTLDFIIALPEVNKS